MKQPITSYLCLFFAIVVVNAVAQDINQLKKDVSFLASDELEGREIGFKGEEEAASYLAKRFEAIGLIPRGLYLANNPAVRHESASFLVTEALKAAWPCQ